MNSQPTKAQKEKSKLTKEEWREYTKTVWHIANTSDPEHPAVFPIEIPTRLIKLFSFHGEMVLDPFGGTGTTALAARELGRRATCVEQNAKYAKLIRERCRDLLSDSRETVVIHGDSRCLDTIADNSVGIVVTSPPYWNKADYGSHGANLGNEPVYPRFFESIRPVFAECLRVLMPGRKLCLVTANVNQHTEHGLLTFPLAADFITLLRDVGFVLVNEIIWSKDGTGGKWGSYGKQRPIFGSYPYPPNFLFKNVHEHIIIVAKPPLKKATGKTVVSYEFLHGRADVPKPARAKKPR
jgi:site-specific DNA-methyltransferase (adenine-specific)